MAVAGGDSPSTSPASENTRVSNGVGSDAFDSPLAIYPDTLSLPALILMPIDSDTFYDFPDTSDGASISAFRAVFS
jgi:hypothetical protein